MTKFERFFTGLIGAAGGAVLGVIFSDFCWSVVFARKMIMDSGDVGFFLGYALFMSAIFVLAERGWRARDYALYGSLMLGGFWLMTVMVTQDINPLSFTSMITSLCSAAAIGAFTGVGFYSLNGKSEG